MSPEPTQKGESVAKERLPFEPKTSRKKNRSTPSSSSRKSKSSQGSQKRTPIRQEDRAIPEVVSKRMIKRMALLSGVPTALGVLTFAISYWILTQTEFDLPHIAVVLVSMGFFGLGVLGLSYGVLSASWDENRVGTLLGWQDFTQNLGRTIAAWRSIKQDKYSE